MVWRVDGNAGEDDVHAAGTERRQSVRVVANGSVIVYGRNTVRGRLSNISSGGMRGRLVENKPRFERGERVDVELHLDRAGATWLRFGGEVQRATDHEVAIAFAAVPLEFANIVQDALSSALEGASLAHVLLVDKDAERRTPFAALLRRAGCHVAEVSTPLETIALLGSSAIHSWVVAIADSAPAEAADALRLHLMESDAPVEVRVLSDQAPTSTLAWFTTTARLSA